jgi:hypothetical protein
VNIASLTGFLLLRLQLIERRLVDHVPGPVIEMAGVRHVLLHLEEFAHEHVVVRIFLAVDKTLL